MKRLIPLTFLLVPVMALAQTPSALQPGAAYVMRPPADDATGRVLLLIPQADGSVGGPILSAEGDILCTAGWTATAQSGADGLRFTQIRLSDDPCADGLQHVAALLDRVRSEVASEEGISLLDATGEELLRLTMGG